MDIECTHLSQEFVTQDLKGKTIYKDQCVKCFSDAYDENGLDLCLKCLNGGCCSNNQHSQSHFQKTGHCVVLKSKMIKQDFQQGEQQQQSITKLAIGKQGGALLEGPSYTPQYSLFCYKCNKTIDQKPIESIITQIKNTSSSFKTQDLIAWELDLFPCEHSLTLAQIPKTALKLDKCNNCDFTTNLWMCLTCGNLGCGRKQYDGTGGNGHGQDHFQNTKHPISVKMGTITADGNASVYCYACQNDVKDDLIASHLVNFGLDINLQIKYEQGMDELNIISNLNLTLSSIIEEGQQLSPIFGAGFTGLQNIGNSCYLNAVLQAVLSIPEFSQKYYQQGQNHLKNCDKLLSATCYLCQISKLVHGQLSGEYSIKKENIPQKNEKGEIIPLTDNQKFYQDGLRIYDFKMLMAGNKKDFQSTQMQDAMEYFEHFLGKVQEFEKKEKQDDSTNIFYFKSTNKLKCIACQGVKYNNAKSNQLKLPVRSPTQQELELAALEKEKQKQQRSDQQEQKSQQKQQQDSENSNNVLKAVEESLDVEGPQYQVQFNECINSVREGEAIQIYCEHCQQNQIFHSRNLFKTLPQYLVVVMNRFVLVNWVPKKLNAYFDVPELVDLSEFCFDGNLSQGEFEIKGNQQAQQQQQNQFQVNQDALDNLMTMGFSRNRCIRALTACNNDAEGASNWIFERMDDLSLDDPIVQQQQQQSGGVKQIATQENIAQIDSMGMGFSQLAITYALNKCDNKVDRAVDFIFSHDNIEQEAKGSGGQQQQQQQEEEAGQEDFSRTKYELYAAIVHLGRSAQSGHYISYIKKNGQWFLYNDSKVAQTTEPFLGKGYFYIFKRL